MLSPSSVGHRKPQLARQCESGLSVPPHWTGPGPITVTVPSKTPLLPCRWHQSIHTRPEPAKQARLENTGTSRWRRGSRGISLSPHQLSFLATLSSLSSAAEPRANLFPRCCGSLQSPAVERSLSNWQRLHGGNVHLLPVCTN